MATPRFIPHERLCRAGLFIGFVVGWAALAPARANAAPRAATTKEPGESAIDAAARARYDEGLRLYSKHRYEDARVAFLQANALRPRPVTTLMLGLCAARLGRWLDALRSIDAYAAEVGEVPQKLRAVVDATRAEAQSHIGRLRFDVPEGSDVTVDDEPVLDVRAPLEVTSGKHTIVVTHRGEKKTQIVEAVAETTVDVKPAFGPKALVPAPDTRTRPSLPSKPDTAEPSSSILSPPDTTWPVYVLGAVGLGGLATAAIFGGLSANENHAVDVGNQTLLRNGRSRALCDGPSVEVPYDDICLTLRKNERLAEQHHTIFVASVAVGAPATLMAFAWFFFAPKAQAEKAAAANTRIVPWVGRGHGGATFEGRF